MGPVMGLFMLRLHAKHMRCNCPLVCVDRFIVRGLRYSRVCVKPHWRLLIERHRGVARAGQ